MWECVQQLCSSPCTSPGRAHCSCSPHPASHSWVCCSASDVTSMMWPWPSLTWRLVPGSELHTHNHTHTTTQALAHSHTTTQTHSELQSCCCAVSELSKLISLTSTAPPCLSSSIYHHSLRHSISRSTQQPLQSPPPPPHIYNKSIPLFASWGVCLSKWLSGLAWYFTEELGWIINSQLSTVHGWRGGCIICVCVYSLSIGPPRRRCLVGTLGWILGHKNTD